MSGLTEAGNPTDQSPESFKKNLSSLKSEAWEPRAPQLPLFYRLLWQLYSWKKHLPVTWLCKFQANHNHVYEISKWLPNVYMLGANHKSSTNYYLLVLSKKHFSLIFRSNQ